MFLKRGNKPYFIFISAPEYQVHELETILPTITAKIDAFDINITVAIIRFSGNRLKEIRRSKANVWFLADDRFTAKAGA